MAVGISQRNRRVSDDGLPESTQTYRWPERVVRLHRLVLVSSILFLGAGLGMQYAAANGADTVQATAFLALVAAGMGLSGVAIVHCACATEVRFTRDSLVVRQPFRRDLALPYSTYEIDWMSDLTAAGHARLIVFDPHRACTVLAPPDWFRTALGEIARIQDEEGWYEPRAEARHEQAEPVAESHG